mmetsp:Transcript_11591/g.33506  ORF Transcript_11591/g.33506 Transcript_11591/m.33506 type:complete len:209 (+) Transcript_11591:2507-3133(+)
MGRTLVGENLPQHMLFGETLRLFRGHRLPGCLRDFGVLRGRAACLSRNMGSSAMAARFTRELRRQHAPGDDGASPRAPRLLEGASGAEGGYRGIGTISTARQQLGRSERQTQRVLNHPFQNKPREGERQQRSQGVGKGELKTQRMPSVLRLWSAWQLPVRKERYSWRQPSAADEPSSGTTAGDNRDPLLVLPDPLGCCCCCCCRGSWS